MADRHAEARNKRKAELEKNRAEWGAMTLEEQALIPPDQRPMSFSPARVHYLDQDVLTAAKERIRHVLTTYDKVAVSYSGGKDSHVVLHLTRMVMDEMGWGSIRST